MSRVIGNVAIIDLCQIECGECGVTFGVPQRFDQQHRKDHDDFYCPNGHILTYEEKPEWEVADRLEEAQQENVRLARRLEVMELAMEQATAAPAATTHPKNGPWVCPHCGRRYLAHSGVWFRKHMIGAHDDLAGFMVMAEARYDRVGSEA